MKTNFSKLTTEQKTVWSRDVWKAARENSFIMQMASKGSNAPIQRITELTKTERGDKAVITLVTDLEGDGVVGDNELEGNEDEIKAYDETITIDQLRNAVTNTGKMNDQKTVVNFRENAKSVLSHWLADRIDQLAILTMSGIAYTRKTNGALRDAASQLDDLSFAADVAAPTANRHLRISGNSIATGNTALVAAGDKLKYNHIIDIHTFAREQFIRPIRTAAGVDIYHMYVPPAVMAELKKDPDFRENIRHAWTRGSNNPLFKGGESYMLDGVVIHSLRHVYTTRGAAAGQKWGAGGAINGSRMLFLGAQALAVADLTGGEWNEKNDFDYSNRQGIAYGKIFGLMKPKFHSQVTGTVEDFGMIAVDVAI